MIGKSWIAGILVLASATAAAAANEVAGPAAGGSAPAVYSQPQPQGLITIFSNMGGKYPKAIYFCCNGFFIQGPTSGGHELWNAQAFTPSVNRTLRRIEVALAYGGGTNEAVIGLYSDNAGVPGTALRSWRVSNLPNYQTCCVIQAVTDSSGISVTAGVQYWVVVKTGSTDRNALIGWLYNTTDQVDAVPFAQYCSNDAGGAPCSTANDAWTAIGGQIPGLAFAVKGN
jgi:hypothetical protein